MNNTIPNPQTQLNSEHLKGEKSLFVFTPLLEIRNLSKYFDGQYAVDDVNLTIYKGEIFVLLGASVCVKSSLTPYVGRVLVAH